MAQYFAGGTGNLNVSLSRNTVGQIVTKSLDSNDYGYTGNVAVNRNYAVNGLNQYTGAGSASFAYDANGSLTADGTNSYIYDSENRLVSATSSGGTALAYDPLGRLWQIANGATGTTQFLSDGDHTAVEYDGGTGAIRRRFYWGPSVDEPVMQDEGGTLNCSGSKFLHDDNQGSIVAVADCWGTRTNVDAYDDWGIPNTTNWGRYQYTGQAWLPELGMYYYKARIYSPTLGRFMQTDPIGYDDQINLYAYVGNDPVDGRDPSGLFEHKKDVGSGCTGTLICPGGNTFGATTSTINPGLSGAGTSDGVGAVRAGKGASNASPGSNARAQAGGNTSQQNGIPAGAGAKSFFQAEKIARRIGLEKLERTRKLTRGYELGGHNDLYDAERHSRWVYRMSMAIGSGWAGMFATAHELGELRQPLIELRMDISNNALGMQSAMNGGGIPTRFTPGLVYIENGQLVSGK